MRSAILRALAMSWVIETAVAPSSLDAFHDQLVDHVGHDRIEAGGRLVEEDDLRLARRWRGPARRASACRRTAPTERARRFPAPRPTLRELGERHLPGLGRRHAVALDQSEGDVLPDAQRVEQGAALEQHAELAHHVGALAIAEAGRLLAVDLDRAAVGPHQAEDAFQQHRLAGARAADHDDRFAGRDVEVDAAQHLLGAEGLVDAAQRDLGRASSRAKKASVMK